MYNYNSNRADIESSLGYQYAFIDRGRVLVIKSVKPSATRFIIYDVSRCISPEYKLRKGDMSSFKLLGNYEFTSEDSSFVTNTFIPNLSNYLGHNSEEAYNNLGELEDSNGRPFFSLGNSGDSNNTTGDEEHLLTKVVVFGNNTAARVARENYLDSHPSARLDYYDTVKDGKWLIRYTAALNFEGEQFNEAVIDGSLLLSVKSADMDRIINELRAAMVSARRG